VSKVKGKEFMFTGRLSVTRNEAQMKVIEAGGIAGSSVCSTTDYLVVGEAYGSKAAKALALGITTLTEQEFWDLFREDTVDEPEDSYSRDIAAAVELGIEIMSPETLKAISEGKRLTPEESIIPPVLLNYIDLLIAETCIGCSRRFYQWKVNSRNKTCVFCKHLNSPPYCSHCNSLLVFIEEYMEYWCQGCKSWWKIAQSYKSPTREDYLRAQGTTNIKKHLHICRMVEVGKVEGGVYETCIGCHKVTYKGWDWVISEKRALENTPARIQAKYIQEEEKREKERLQGIQDKEELEARIRNLPLEVLESTRLLYEKQQERIKRRQDRKAGVSSI